MSNRKSQVEKFQAKWGKKQMDEQVIHEANAKRSLEKVGGNVMKKYGKTEEDIFAIFGREHIGTFIKQWNNSLQSTIEKSVQPLVQEIQSLREENVALREQMQEIVSSTIYNSMDSLMQGITESMDIDLPEIELPEIIFPTQESEMSKAAKSMSVPIQDHEVVDGIPRTGRGIDWKRIEKEGQLEEILFKLIAIAENEGVDVSVGKLFKSHGTDFNGAYQRYLSNHKGVRGAWSGLIEKYRSSVYAR